MKIDSLILTVILFLSCAARSMEDPRERREKETESPKRERECSEHEAQQKPVKKSKTGLTSQEQAKLHSEFLLALVDATKHALSNQVFSEDLARAKEALDNGADIWTGVHVGIHRYSLLTWTLLQALPNHERFTRIMPIIQFLLEQGAFPMVSDLTSALRCQAFGNAIIDQLFRYGRGFRAITQLDMLHEAVSLFEEHDQPRLHRFEHPQQKRAHASAALLWIILRNNTTGSDALLDVISKHKLSPFTTPDFHVMTLEERLGPILLTLLRGNQDEVREFIEDLARRFAVTQENKIQVQAAFIFAAAHGNLEILSLMLIKLRQYLSRESIREAMQAAVLTGQFKSFQTLIESNLLWGDELSEVLESALLTATSQTREDIVRYILNLDSIHNLNLAIAPALRRIEFLNCLFPEPKSIKYLDFMKSSIDSGNLENFTSAMERYKSLSTFDIILKTALQRARARGRNNIVQFIEHLNRVYGLNLDASPDEKSNEARAIERVKRIQSNSARLRSALADYVHERAIRRFGRRLESQHVERSPEEIAQAAQELLAKEKASQEEEEEPAQSESDRLEDLIRQLEAEELERREQAIRTTAGEVGLSAELIRRLWSLPKELILPILLAIQFRKK